jgi:hypothetical protein
MGSMQYPIEFQFSLVRLTGLNDRLAPGRVSTIGDGLRQQPLPSNRPQRIAVVPCRALHRLASVDQKRTDGVGAQEAGAVPTLPAPGTQQVGLSGVCIKLHLPQQNAPSGLRVPSRMKDGPWRA